MSVSKKHSQQRMILSAKGKPKSFSKKAARTVIKTLKVRRAAAVKKHR
ncbi:MAG: hypothetical protein H0T47_21920 [Planctomycetaceae bacterium]|nr:hypothetical protein [Planctomycetaceae bacterium]